MDWNLIQFDFPMYFELIISWNNSCVMWNITYLIA